MAGKPYLKDVDLSFAEYHLLLIICIVTIVVTRPFILL